MLPTPISACFCQAPSRLPSNPCAITAAKARIGGTRSGRETNDATVIFVRGAQPVIVNNVFHNNAGAVIAVGDNWLPSPPAVALVAGMQKPGAEGYRLAIENTGKPLCAVIGADDRGVRGAARIYRPHLPVIGG